METPPKFRWMVMICDDQENTNLLNCKMRQRHICPLRSGQSNMSQLVLTLLIHQVALLNLLDFDDLRKIKRTCESKLLRPSIQGHPVPARCFHLPNQEHPRQSAPEQSVFERTVPPQPASSYLSYLSLSCHCQYTFINIILYHSISILYYTI